MSIDTDAHCDGFLVSGQRCRALTGALYGKWAIISVGTSAPSAFSHYCPDHSEQAVVEFRKLLGLQQEAAPMPAYDGVRGWTDDQVLSEGGDGNSFPLKAYKAKMMAEEIVRLRHATKEST